MGRLNRLGSAVIDPPDDLLDQEGYIHDLAWRKGFDPFEKLVCDLYDHKSEFFDLGVDEIKLDYYVYDKGHILLSFEPDIQKKLGEMNVVLCVRCFPDFIDCDESFIYIEKYDPTGGR